MKYTEEQLEERLIKLNHTGWASAIRNYSLFYEVTQTFNNYVATDVSIDDYTFLNLVDSAMSEWDV